MRARLTNGSTIEHARLFFHALDPATSDGLQVEFDLDCHQVHPVVAATIASLAVDITSSGGRVETLLAEPPGPNLYRLGLGDYLALPAPPRNGHEGSGALIPVTQIRTGEDAADVMTDLFPLLHASTTEADAMHYVISELVRNVLEHSYSPTGAFLSATYDSATRRIAVGVADAGRGIRLSLGQYHRVGNDEDALLLALRPGVSGTTSNVGGTADNAGLGLFYTKAIASSSAGDFLVASGDSQFHLAASGPVDGMIHANPLEDPTSSVLRCNLVRGTAVGVDFYMTASETFAQILREVGEHATRSISLAKREQKRQRHRKPRFT